MANTFKLKTKDGSAVGANTDIVVYTVPSATTSVVIGITLANITSSAITVDIKIENNDGDNIFYGKDLPVPTGSSLDALAGKIVLETSDVVKVQSDTANSVDIALSIMEQT